MYPLADYLPCSVPSLHGHYPASSLLRADPPPMKASASLGIAASLPLLTYRETSNGLPSSSISPYPSVPHSATPIPIKRSWAPPNPRPHFANSGALEHLEFV